MTKSLNLQWGFIVLPIKSMSVHTRDSETVLNPVDGIQNRTRSGTSGLDQLRIHTWHARGNRVEEIGQIYPQLGEGSWGRVQTRRAKLDAVSSRKTSQEKSNPPTGGTSFSRKTRQHVMVCVRAMFCDWGFGS